MTTKEIMENIIQQKGRCNGISCNGDKCPFSINHHIYDMHCGIRQKYAGDSLVNWYKLKVQMAENYLFNEKKNLTKK